MTAGLYIHIPFCKKKCNYCAFCSFTETNEEIHRKYLKCIQKEIDFSPNLPFKTIYIGGGTPTLLSKGSIIKLSKIIENLFSKKEFCPIEITIEANPGTITFYKLKTLRESGINRLSIGAQSFDDEELKILGRIHNCDEIYKSYESAIKAGFVNINFDLIFGIPGQSLKSWLKTLEKAVKLKPKHISAYCLQIEKGTPISKLISQKSPFDKSDEEYILYKETIDFLKSNGYVQYEISNFSLPGYECLHNINYWENGDYIGIGVSSSSHYNNGRKKNTSDLAEYIKNPLNNLKMKKQPEKNEISETIIMGLRLTKGIDTYKFKDKFKKSIEDLFKTEIEEMTKLNLVKFDGNYLKLTKKGLFLANEVMEKFV